MAKINTEAFNRVSENANLSQTNKKANDEVRRNTSVYDIPMIWIDAIKKNNVSVSSYIKQAIIEKLTRDSAL